MHNKYELLKLYKVMEMDTQEDKTNLSGNKADTPAEKDVYEIRLNSYKIAGALGVSAVHNEVAFYKNGKIVTAFNGNAHSKQSGELSPYATKPGNVLRVTATNFDYTKIMELSGSVTLAKLERDDWETQIDNAILTGRFINSNPIDYIVLGGSENEAQNSNSVATSILHALGYKYPSNELKNLWAPGSQRLLTPDNWNSKLRDSFSAPEPSLLARDEVIRQTREISLATNISADSSNPYPTTTQQYFDPNAESVVFPDSKKFSRQEASQKNLQKIHKTFEDLKKNNPEELQSLLDKEILKAMRPGSVFPENIFLAQEPQNEITQDHRDAAKNLRDEILYAVSNHLNISIEKAENLQRYDQYHFAQTLAVCVKEKKIPAPHLRDSSSIKTLIAEELKINPENFDDVAEEHPEDVLAAYRKLKRTGALQEESPPNPHLLKYASQYLTTIQRNFTPTEPALTENYPSLPPKNEDTTENLKLDANQKVYDVMSAFVAQKLKISPDKISEIPDSKFFKLVKEGLKKGEIPLKTEYPLSAYEKDLLISKELDVDVHLLGDHPSFIRYIAHEKLEKNGAFQRSRPNPHVKGEIENEIRAHERLTPDIKPESKKPIKAAIHVDLHAEGGATMEIGGMSVRSYFSLQADPATAQTDNSPQPTRPAPLVKEPAIGLNA